MTVIANASAGGKEGAEALRTVLARAFSAVRAAEPRILIVGQGAAMTELARTVIAEGERVIVAGGGDGTISSVARAVAGTEAVLGVLPLGTLNHFAKDLRIPIDLEAAARVVAAGRIAAIDVAEVNGRLFLNNSSLGLYPRIVTDRREQQRKGRGKWAALFWATLRALRRFPFMQVRLDADGTQLSAATPFVFIGNNEYQVEGFDLGTRERLDAGCLWLYITPHGASRADLLRLAFLAAVGRLRQDQDFNAVHAREVWIETRRRAVHVALDGEVVLMEPPLHYRIRPRCLRVLAPEPV